jgi:class III poly(R)-hydroxyalkanoic acid synthase PhaE subunit
MNTWMQFAGPAQPSTQGFPFSAGSGDPWTSSFEQWSRLFGQSMPAESKTLSNRLFELGKSYLNASQNFWRMLQENREYTSDWQEMLANARDQFCKGFESAGGANDPWSGFATLWGLPMSNWQRMACSFSPFPGEMEKALRESPSAPPSDITRAARQYLSLPPVGYTREWQEQLQEWQRLVLEYTHALEGFGTLLGKVTQRALELFGQQMTEKIKAGESLDGLRAVYDLWIDCGEDAYAEQVATRDFPHLQAQLVNALMRMKRHEQLMLEEVMTALNMPTRQEMDTTHMRVHELQQQLRHLQDTLDESAEAPANPRAPAPKKAVADETGSTVKRGARKKTKRG